MTSLSRAIAVSFLALSTLAASAQVSSSSTITGPNGQKATRTVNRTAGATNATVTGPNGQSATRSKTYGNGSAQSTLTGPNGATASHNVTGRGTGTVTATSTGPRGATASRVRTSLSLPLSPGPPPER